jgi:vacuolar protein sorting-associated protein 18
MQTCIHTQAALDDVLAADCPLCGDIMIKSVEKPFVQPGELDVIRSWEL